MGDHLRTCAATAQAATGPRSARPPLKYPSRRFPAATERPHEPTSHPLFIRRSGPPPGPPDGGLAEMVDISSQLEFSVQQERGRPPPRMSLGRRLGQAPPLPRTSGTNHAGEPHEQPPRQSSTAPGTSTPCTAPSASPRSTPWSRRRAATSRPSPVAPRSTSDAPENSCLWVDIDAATVSTGNEQRDGHLQQRRLLPRRGAPPHRVQEHQRQARRRRGDHGRETSPSPARRTPSRSAGSSAASPRTPTATPARGSRATRRSTARTGGSSGTPPSRPAASWCPTRSSSSSRSRPSSAPPEPSADHANRSDHGGLP